MKKLSLLFGTLGGAFAGYVLSNKKLREELSSAKNTEQVAKALGKHLQKDGNKLAGQVHELLESDEVQQNLEKAKKFAKKKFDEAKNELGILMDKGAAKAKSHVKQATKVVQKKAKKATGRKPARMKTKTRTVSK